MVKQTIIVPTYEEMVEICRTIQNGMFVFLNSTMKVRMNKGGRQGLNIYYDRVFKNVRGNVRPLCDFKLRMDNENEKRGLPEHQLGRNKVGTKVDEVGCVTFNEKLNKHYFMYEFFEGVKVKVDYITDTNDPIERQLFDQWVIKSQPNEVNTRQVYIDNINEITINHTRYVRSRV